MTPKQFFILVAQMRMAQKKYLSTYDRRQLDLVKRMEKYLDMEIKFAKKKNRNGNTRIQWHMRNPENQIKNINPTKKNNHDTRRSKNAF